MRRGELANRGPWREGARGRTRPPGPPGEDFLPGARGAEEEVPSRWEGVVSLGPPPGPSRTAARVPPEGGARAVWIGEGGGWVSIRRWNGMCSLEEGWALEFDVLHVPTDRRKRGLNLSGS